MIHCEYDAEIKALYVRLAERKVASSVSLSPGFLVDLDAEGSLIGLEVLDLCMTWPIDELVERYGLGADTAAALAELAPFPCSASAVSASVMSDPALTLF